MGFTDLIAGLTAAALALVGGLAYSEWGVVALAVGATVAVDRSGDRDLVSRRPPAASRPSRPDEEEGRLAAPLLSRRVSWPTST